MSTRGADEPVSVVIPCYNVAPYLEAAVASVLHQTHESWECIIVDDGSTDNCLDIARRLSRSDKRIHFVTQQNRGLSAARNRGLKEVTTRFVQFLDGDDLLDPGKLAAHLRVLQDKSDIDIVYGDSWAFMEANPAELLPMPPCEMVEANPLEEFVARWERGLSITVHAVLFRTACFERWGGFDERLPNHEDWDLYLRFSAAGARYQFVPGRLALYRIREGSMARRPDSMHHGKCLVLSKHLANAAMPLRYRCKFALQFCLERVSPVLELVRDRQWRAGLRYASDPGLGRPWSYICVSGLVVLMALRGLLAIPRRARQILTRCLRAGE